MYIWSFDDSKCELGVGLKADFLQLVVLFSLAWTVIDNERSSIDCNLQDIIMTILIHIYLICVYFLRKKRKFPTLFYHIFCLALCLSAEFSFQITRIPEQLNMFKDFVFLFTIGNRNRFNTECPKIYRKSVLDLHKYRFAVFMIKQMHNNKFWDTQ